MLKKLLMLLMIIILFGGMCLLNKAATKKVFESQPDWYFLTLHSYKKFMHILGVGLGFRSLMADFDYISFLQYYGNRKNLMTRYKELYKYIDDITDADPHFTFVYTYGSAILAFNLQRYGEAIEVIKKGLAYNPAFWKLRFYLGAIVYKQKGEQEKYIELLEEALKFDDHPAMIERLLGNIYEQYKSPDEAAEYWIKIYKETRDKRTREHAYERLMLLIKEKKIKDIKSVLDKL